VYHKYIMLIQTLYRFLHTILFPDNFVSTDLTPSSHPHAVLSYKDRNVRSIVWNIKYRKHQRAIEVAGLHLYEYIIKKVTPLLTHASEPILLIPVPMSAKSLKRRGHNQTSLLIQKILKYHQHKEFEFKDNLVIK